MKILILADRRLRETADGIKKLTEAFIQGYYKASISDKSVDLIIEKFHINPCKGCNSCWQTSKTQCNNIGDAQNLYQHFQDADLIIWSLPLFYFNSPSIMKAFVGVKAKRPNNSDPQKHVVISIGSFLGKDTEAIDKQFSDMYKDKYIKILCPQGELFSLPQMKSITDKYQLAVKRAGFEFASAGKISPQIEKLLTMPLFDKEAYLQRKQGKA